jgi:hypothetical protein
MREGERRCSSSASRGASEGRGAQRWRPVERAAAVLVTKGGR